MAAFTSPVIHSRALWYSKPVGPELRRLDDAGDAFHVDGNEDFARPRRLRVQRETATTARGTDSRTSIAGGILPDGPAAALSERRER